MNERTRKVNVLWTFNRMNRKADGMPRIRPNVIAIVLPLLNKL